MNDKHTYTGDLLDKIGLLEESNRILIEKMERMEEKLQRRLNFMDTGETRIINRYFKTEKLAPNGTGSIKCVIDTNFKFDLEGVQVKGAREFRNAQFRLLIDGKVEIPEMNILIKINGVEQGYKDNRKICIEQKKDGFDDIYEISNIDTKEHSFDLWVIYYPKDYDIANQIYAKAASEHTHTFEKITDKPTTYAPSAHTHEYSAPNHTHTFEKITDKPASYPPSTHTHDYSASSHSHTFENITAKPTSYPPSTHIHDYALPNHTHDYSASSHSHTFENITAKPTSYPPSTHTHDYSSSTHTHSWGNITDKPFAFPAESHGHTQYLTVEKYNKEFPKLEVTMTNPDGKIGTNGGLLRTLIVNCRGNPFASSGATFDMASITFGLTKTDGFNRDFQLDFSWKQQEGKAKYFFYDV